MTALKYNLVSVDDDANLTLFVGGEMYIAASTHANWQKIIAGVLAGDASVVDLFDVAKTVSQKFERLTDRATVLHGVLYFDGDPMHNALADEVVRFIDAGVDDWKPLVNFLEKVQQNPQEHSKEQLFSWMKNKNFTITPDGDIVGYKSVRSDGAEGFLSISGGKATVNGVVHEGKIPQKVGDVVEMPRSEVAFDPFQGCGTGLHVANWDYASTWSSHDHILAIGVNPRDVVSVPTDSDFQKVRVCRYTVLSVIDHVLEDIVYSVSDVDDEDDDEEYCDYCGEDGHDEYSCDVQAQDEADEEERNESYYDEEDEDDEEEDDEYVVPVQEVDVPQDTPAEPQPVVQDVTKATRLHWWDRI